MLPLWCYDMLHHTDDAYNWFSTRCHDMLYHTDDAYNLFLARCHQPIVHILAYHINHVMDFMLHELFYFTIVIYFLLFLYNQKKVSKTNEPFLQKHKFQYLHGKWFLFFGVWSRVSRVALCKYWRCGCFWSIVSILWAASTRSKTTN